MTDLTIDWVSELRSVLAHWHNTPYLENHRLTQLLGSREDGPGTSRAQALRRVLRLAIEQLQPITPLPPGAPEARPAEILYRHYVAKQSMPQIALNLDICEREAYRELRSAMEALARIVQERYNALSPAPPSGGQVREEVERLAVAQSEELDIVQLLTDVTASAQQLARERGVVLEFQAQVPRLAVAANRVMLRQAILNLLSHLVRDHRDGPLVVQLEAGKDSACLRVRYTPCAQPDTVGDDQPYAVSAQLFDSLGIRWSREALSGESVEIRICLPLVHEHTVLLVDDNEGLTTLLTRYLRHTPFCVYSANRWQEALELVSRLHPDVVLIDVMMPEHDGWELMERLRATEAGRKARLIVCSIINDPELALALGADAFLHKPVERATLLDAIQRVLARPASPALGE